MKKKHIDKLDFSAVQRNEESELKGNFKVPRHKQLFFFPTQGPVFMFYNFFFAVHKILTAFYIPMKAAFEDTPEDHSVYFDFYLDAVFLIDIIITFNMPLYD